MKTTLLATTAALLFAGAGIAGAQALIITEQQQPVIQRYIIQQQIAPAEMPSGFDPAVGVMIPDTVELYPLEVPEIQMEQPYDYVIVNGRTLLVDPQTRQVMQIIE